MSASIIGNRRSTASMHAAFGQMNLNTTPLLNSTTSGETTIPLTTQGGMQKWPSIVPQNTAGGIHYGNVPTVVNGQQRAETANAHSIGSTNGYEETVLGNKSKFDSWLQSNSTAGEASKPSNSAYKRWLATQQPTNGAAVPRADPKLHERWLKQNTNGFGEGCQKQIAAQSEITAGGGVVQHQGKPAIFLPNSNRGAGRLLTEEEKVARFLDIVDNGCGTCAHCLSKQ